MGIQVRLQPTSSALKATLYLKLLEKGYFYLRSSLERCRSTSLFLSAETLVALLIVIPEAGALSPKVPNTKLDSC